MRSFDYDYFKKPMNRFGEGQCTWYAWGRTYELNHVALELDSRADAGSWLTKCTGPKGDIEIIKGQTIKANSVAVFPYHVVFIEHYSTTSDEAYVTFSGANDSNYDNGEFVTITESEFKTKYGTLKGIIHIK